VVSVEMPKNRYLILVSWASIAASTHSDLGGGLAPTAAPSDVIGQYRLGAL
jgi:hypothetical protein